MPQATTYTSYTSATATQANTDDQTAATNVGTYTYVISTSPTAWSPALSTFYTSRSDARNAKRLLAASDPNTTYYIFRFANADMDRVS
jgi:hypothetical protein